MALLQGMDATDEGTEHNGGGPSGAEAAKTQPQTSQKQQQQPRPRPKVVTKAKMVGSKVKQSNIMNSILGSCQGKHSQTKTQRAGLAQFLVMASLTGRRNRLATLCIAKIKMQLLLHHTRKPISAIPRSQNSPLPLPRKKE